MSKKRKAEELMAAEPEQRQNKNIVEDNDQAQATEPVKKKPKKRKTEESAVDGPKKRQKEDTNTATNQGDATESTKKSKKGKADDPTADGSEKRHKEHAIKPVAQAEATEPVKKKSKKDKPSKSDDTRAEQPISTVDSAAPAVQPITLETSTKTAGEKRQAKSERPKRNKKGKIIHTREMALERNRLVQEKKKERKEALKQARLVPLSSLQQTAAASEPTQAQSDTLASGSDFVPLFTEDTKPTDLKAILPPGAQLTSITNEAGERMVMMPKKSKKGLTKHDRKAKAEANRNMMKEKTAKKKEKKARKLSRLNPDPITEEEAMANALNPASQADANTSNNQEADNHETTIQPSSTAPRFILFIGNLPFNTTTTSLETHFSSLTPISIRHSTDRNTQRSKGFAFLEFASYDKMKTCLKVYHHSYFNPEKAGEAPVILDEVEAQRVDAEMALARKKKGGDNAAGWKDKGRRINVELTAGGGGQGDQRKEKIKLKNQRLAEQRERRVIKERAEKEKERAEKLAKGPATGVNADMNGDSRGDIHPSRMSRVQG